MSNWLYWFGIVSIFLLFVYTLYRIVKEFSSDGFKKDMERLRANRERAQAEYRAAFEASRLAPHGPMPHEIVKLKPKLYGDAIFGRMIECDICDEKTRHPHSTNPQLRWMVDVPLPMPNELGRDKFTLCPKCVQQEFDLQPDWYLNLQKTEDEIRKAFRAGEAN